MLVYAVIIAVSCFAVGYWLARKRQRPRIFPISYNQMRKIQAFDEISDAHLELIKNLVHYIVAPADSWLFKEGEKGDALYLILSGRINILKRGKLDYALVKTVGPNEYTGEMSLLTGATRNAAGRTLTNVELLRFSRNDFMQLIESVPELREQVWLACETHALSLALSDHEKLRAMSLKSRLEWIEKRDVFEFESGTLSPSSSDAGYLAVISGSVKVGKNLFESPALIDLSIYAPADCVAAIGSRLAWLTKIN